MPPRLPERKSPVRPKYEFRCFSRPTLRGTVLAECIDLGLLVEADTQLEAREKLHQQICSYVEIAFERENPSDLIPRRSPVSGFAWYYLISAVVHGRAFRRTALMSFRLPIEGLATAC